MNTSDDFAIMQTAVTEWGAEGGQWLEDAERMMAETHRLLREIENREQQILEREAAFEGWQRSLEQREKLLVERERLLTEGLVQMSGDRTTDLEPVLESLLSEINEIRQTLRGSEHAKVTPSVGAPAVNSSRGSQRDRRAKNRR